MCLGKGTDKKMHYLKEKLHELIGKKQNLLDPEVIYISQLLDNVLNEYNEIAEMQKEA